MELQIQDVITRLDSYAVQTESHQGGVRWPA